ncbi:MAG: nucleoside transporter C-terminal domain-containing protein [Aerococcus sp.]|nr:nucleoside transporter C-terminal domain-containing protein [Aerococcus sp.]
MTIIRALLGLVVIGALAYLLSNNKRQIIGQWKQLGLMLIYMIVLAFVCLKTTAGIAFLGGVSNFMSWLFGQAQAGVSFVFGGIAINEGAFVFFFNVLCPLVFMSALIGILDYIKVLPFCMKWIGWLINKITGVGELEGQFAISGMLLGEPACFLTVEDIAKQIDEKRMFTFVMSATGTVGANMLAAYMNVIEGKYVVVAVILNIFSAFIISKIMNPYDPEALKQQEAKDDRLEHPTDGTAALTMEEKQSFFDMLGTYMMNGWNLALAVAGTLIGFIALIGFLNNVFQAIVGMTLTEIVGYVFSPLAFGIGIQTDDIVQAGSIMATKLFTNELVGMQTLEAGIKNLSPRTVAMLSTYLVSYANFGTIGIISGALRSLDQRQARFISSQSLKIIAGATLASCLTATIVGIFY